RGARPGKRPRAHRPTSLVLAATWRSSPRPITCMSKTKRTKKTAPSGSKRLTAEVTQAVKAALEKKASDVLVLDLRHTPAFTDFFIVCSGQNTRQVKAIADSIEESLR